MDRNHQRARAGRGGVGTLASRLEHVDHERFVGRAVELAALESCLAEDSATSVIHVYGPGGIGKSTLLREFARRAQAQGWERFVVEGRELTPSPDALEALLAAAAASSRPLVLIDTYERMNGLGGYLRRSLLPALPDNAVVVIAGRNPPEEAWFQGGWETVAGEFELGKLPTWEALALLEAHGVTDPRPDRHRRLGRRLAAGAGAGRRCRQRRPRVGSGRRRGGSGDPALAHPAPGRGRDGQRCASRSWRWRRLRG